MMNIVFIVDFKIVSSKPLQHFFQPFVLDEDQATVWSRKTEFNVPLQSENSYSGSNKILYFALLSLFAREFFSA